MKLRTSSFSFVYQSSKTTSALRPQITYREDKFRDFMFIEDLSKDVFPVTAVLGTFTCILPSALLGMKVNLQIQQTLQNERQL